MAKSIKLKNNTYLDSSSISHKKMQLNNILEDTLKKVSSGDMYSLKEFVEATADGVGCGFCRIYTNNNFFNLDSADWVKVFYMYQNVYTSNWDVNGIAIVAKQSGATYLVIIHGSSGSYTATSKLL